MTMGDREDRRQSGKRGFSVCVLGRANKWA